MILSYGRQKIFSRDKLEILKAINNNLITSGPYVNRFENSIKKKLDSKYASVCSSGTAAIHLAIEAIDTVEDDIFILPVINFICASNILEQKRAKIFYADVDPVTGQMTPKNLIDCIKTNKIKKIKAFFTMYLGGDPKNIEQFYDIKKKYKCLYIEDACHALGSKYLFKNSYFNVGCCKHSDIATFSLHPLKSITSGEGGVVTTNNRNFNKKIENFRSHGILRSKNHWVYDIVKPGLNYRLSDINCALAYSQLKSLNKIIAKRRKILSYYLKIFKNNEHISINEQNSFSACHLIIAKFKKKTVNKNSFFKYLFKMKIYIQQHYIPIYKFKFYRKKIKESEFPGAKLYFKDSFSLPIFYDLSFIKIRFIKKILLNYFK